MKITRQIIISGIVIVIFGIIFHLQANSILGPESSFMYANPDWITYGIEIIVFGIITLSFGIFWQIRSNL